MEVDGSESVLPYKAEDHHGYCVKLRIAYWLAICLLPFPAFKNYYFFFFSVLLEIEPTPLLITRQVSYY